MSKRNRYKSRQFTAKELGEIEAQNRKNVAYMIKNGFLPSSRMSESGDVQPRCPGREKKGKAPLPDDEFRAKYFNEDGTVKKSATYVQTPKQ